MKAFRGAPSFAGITTREAVQSTIDRLERERDEARRSLSEFDVVEAYFKGRGDRWRGIAAAMGYEPLAHLNVRPTEDWIVARIAKFRAQAAEEELGPQHRRRVTELLEANNREVENRRMLAAVLRKILRDRNARVHLSDTLFGEIEDALERIAR